MSVSGATESVRARLIAWFSYFAILLCCAMPQGINTPIDAVGFNTTGITEIPRMAKLADLVSMYGQGDAGIYATMATHIGQGQFTDYEYWRLRLFAPGNTFIEAACLKFFGPDFPIALFCTFLVCALWASVMFNIRALGQYKQHPIWCFLTPLFLCCLGLFEIHLLNRGVVLSESMSAAQLSLGFLYTLRSIRERHWQFAAVGGLFMAIAAYVRAQNEIVCLFLTLAGIAVTCLCFAWHNFEHLKKRRSESFWSFLKTTPALSSILIALLAYNALTIPYRCWNVAKYQSPNWLQWDHYWEANWRDENLMRTRDHDQGLIDAGETVAARVNPELAASIQKEVNVKGPFAFPDDYYKRSSIITFLTHPTRWVSLKYPAARKAWRDGTTDFKLPGSEKPLRIEFLLYLCTLLFCAIRFIFISALGNKLKGEELWYLLFCGALLASNAATTIFIHLEARYYYTIKIVTVVLLLGYFLSRKNNVQTD